MEEKDNLNYGELESQAPLNDIIKPFIKDIFYAATSLTKNQTEAEDLAQETLCLAVENINQLRDKTKCKSWLFAILRNQFFKTIALRKKLNE